jgi:hypothetical protein
MPQLTRIRFVNLGHANARVEDLTIPLQDKAGRSADSILWLRNGGGKSALLSLFFSLIKPHRNQFLHSKRRLEDYIRFDDCAVVVAEWQLDTPTGEAPQHYLTGVFCQWRQENLERLFFASRVEDPAITFENIPIKTERGERRTLYSFRQAWQNLTKLYPAAESQETMSQQTWREILEQALIDPELFGYQIHMNSQEGGADKLFASFNTTDQFVDFFVKIMMPVDESEIIANNLKLFSERLRERKLLETELAMIISLKPKILPVIEIALQRQKHREYTGNLYLQVKQLKLTVEKRQIDINERKIEIANNLNNAQKFARKLSAEADLCNQQMITFQRVLLKRRTNRLVDEQQNLEKQLNETSHFHSLWSAASLFTDVIHYETGVRSLEENLRLQTIELAPDWDNIHSSAHLLAGALLARANENEQIAAAKSAEAIQHQSRSKDARRKSNNIRGEIGSSKNQIRQFEKEIKQNQESRKKLEKAGILDFEEPLQTAIERREKELREIVDLEKEITVQSEKFSQLLESLSIKLEESRHISFKAHQNSEDKRKILSAAYAKRDNFLSLPVIKQLFGEPDPNILNDASLSILRDEQSVLETKWREFGVRIVESEFMLDYLEKNNLLPPTRDVRIVIEFLEKEDIIAFAGWKFIAEMYQEQNQARVFISRHPEIALGVLVPDNDFETAKDLLIAKNPELGSAVIIFPRSFADALDTDQDIERTDSSKRFVLGPTSAAYFESNAAASEKSALKLRLQRERSEREKIEQEEGELRRAANDLQEFLTTYPKGWSEQQEAEVRDAEAYHQECVAQIAEIEIRQIDARSLIKQSKEKLAALFGNKRQIEQYLDRLNLHRDLCGTDEKFENLVTEKSATEMKINKLLFEIEDLEKLIEAEDKFALHLNETAKTFSLQSEKDLLEIKSVEYLEGEPKSKVGNIESLKEIHQNLCDLIKQKLNVDNLQTKLDREKEKLGEARKRFDNEGDKNLAETEVRQLTETTPDKNTILTRIKETDERKSTLLTLSGENNAEVKIAQKELDDHRTRYSKFSIETDDVEADLSEDKLEQRITLLEAETENYRAKASEFKFEIERFQREAEQIQSLQKLIEERILQVRRLIDDDVFQDAVKLENISISLSEVENENYLQQLSDNVINARRKRTKLLEERNTLHYEFIRFLENETFEFTHPLKHWSVEYFEANIEQLLSELEIREKTIQDDLSSSESHRRSIIDSLLGEAERGLKQLRDLANNSKLPETAGSLANHNFLRIDMRIPESRAEKSERIAALIDDIAHQNQIPDAIEIVQRAVRKIPQQPISIRVLFPDVDALKPQYRPVTAMSGESEGERLTSAVLLYCALMRQRAKERGTNRNASSVLLLDNPFGKATRRKFVELQRETAQAMNIQLIYPTGVDSFEALSVFPNIVRLRNEMRADNGDCLLEIARIGLR